MSAEPPSPNNVATSANASVTAPFDSEEPISPEQEDDNTFLLSDDAEAVNARIRSGEEFHMLIPTSDLGFTSPQGLVSKGGALTSEKCRQEIAILEKAIADEIRRREEMEEEEAKIEEIKRQISEAEANEEHTKFMTQSTFRWSVPPGSESYSVIPSVVEDGFRVRPEVPAALPRDIPPVPSHLMPLEEQELKLGERHAALQVKHAEIAARRRAAEFDMGESLFVDAVSSDDSEGYDEDFNEEWRDETSAIYSACRSYESDFSSDEAATNFRQMLKALCRKKEDDVTPTERMFVWDTLRLMYRAAEPLHAKHWLAGSHEIINVGTFQSRPSIADYSCILHTALNLKCLTERQYRKVERWANRSTFMVRKRVAILQEFGVAEPTWHDINASCGGWSRKVKVPTMTLNDTLTALTKKSVQQEASPNTKESFRRAPSDRDGEALYVIDNASVTHQRNTSQFLDGLLASSMATSDGSS